LIVVSAGNEGGPVDSPANCPSVIAVAGVRHAGTKVGYSNLGPEVALSAPAGNCGTGSGCLYSLDTTTNSGGTSPDPNGYTYTSQVTPNLGTSFSAPIVSGIAALMHAVNANLTPAQLRARLQEGSKPFPTQALDTGTTQQCAPEPQGSTNVQNTECVCTQTTCGAGLASAAGAVAAALRPIASIAVTSSVTPGGVVTLDATHSAAACGRTVAGYQWQAVPATSATVMNDTQAIATVNAPTSGGIMLRVTVTDDQGASDSADISIYPTFVFTQAPTDAGSVSCPAAISIPTDPGTGSGPSSTTGSSASPAANSGGGGGAWSCRELLLVLALACASLWSRLRRVRASQTSQG
jgi:serine protease